MSVERTATRGDDRGGADACEPWYACSGRRNNKELVKRELWRFDDAFPRTASRWTDPLPQVDPEMSARWRWTLLLLFTARSVRQEDVVPEFAGAGYREPNVGMEGTSEAVARATTHIPDH